jgi:hypothetical protein
MFRHTMEVSLRSGGIRIGAVLMICAVLLSGCAPADRPRSGSAPRSPRPSQPTRASSTAPTRSANPAATGKKGVTAPREVWLRRYGWAEGDNLLSNAATFSLVQGLTPEQALRILAPHPATKIESVPAAQRWELRQPYRPSGPNAQLIVAQRRAGWTMILEDNGFEATEVAARLSRSGRAVVIYNNVNALTSFQYARQGRVLRYFDPLLYSNYGPGKRLRQERGISFGHSPWPYIAQSLLLAERITGLRVRPSDLDLNTYPIAIGVRF